MSLDEFTATRVRRIINAARRDGLDEANALDSKGLVLSPKSKKVQTVAALEDLLADLRTWRPAEFLRRVNKVEASTPADMHRAIMGYIEDYVADKGKQ